MKGGEIAALLKAASAGIQVGNILLNEFFDFEKSALKEVEKVLESTLDIDDPEELAREYRKLLQNCTCLHSQGQNRAKTAHRLPGNHLKYKIAGLKLKELLAAAANNSFK